MAPVQPDENRPLAQQTSSTPVQRRALILRVVLIAVLIGALGALVSRLNLRRDMGHLDVGMLSGVPEGNYNQLVKSLADLAGEGKGPAAQRRLGRLGRQRAAPRRGREEL